MKFDELLSRLKPKYSLVLELEGKPVVDERLASLLKLVRETGSILHASKVLGFAYSRAWEAVFKAERLLGVRLINRRPGRTESRLTDEGRTLLDLYLRHKSISLPVPARPGLVYAGSHDPLLSEILQELKADVHWVGSLAGLVSLFMGDADVSGMHLFDSATGEYNTPFIERLGLADRVKVFPFFEREVGIAYRGEIKGLDDLFTKKWVNRNPGSGTRLLFEELIEERSKALGIPPKELRRSIEGYAICLNTHEEVAETIASGGAEVGITIRSMAEAFGLKFIPLRWERFDIIVSKNSLEKYTVKEFLDRVKELRKRLKEYSGYRPSKLR